MTQTQRTRDPYAVLQVRPDAHPTVLTAAYRALAALYHPDRNQSPGAASQMRELNAAYASVRTPEARAATDERLRTPAPAAATKKSAKEPTQPDAPRRPGPSRVDGPSLTVDFGRYSGWTIAEIARHDPDYLRWLTRHSAGQPYRAEIGRRLADAAAAQRTAAARPAAPSRRWAVFGGRD